MHSSASRSNTLIILISSRRRPIKYTCGLQSSTHLKQAQEHSTLIRDNLTAFRSEEVVHVSLYMYNMHIYFEMGQQSKRKKEKFRKNIDVFELMILWFWRFKHLIHHFPVLGGFVFWSECFTFTFFTFHIADRKLCWFRRYVFTVKLQFFRLFSQIYHLKLGFRCF